MNLFSLSVEQLTLLLSVINSTLMALFFIYMKYGMEKRLKKYEYFLGDASELNTKMHDRLVEVEDLIAKAEIIPENLKKRLLMNASRLNKYDPNISHDLDDLIKKWNSEFMSTDFGWGVSIIGLTDRQKECSVLIKEIKNKVDKLVK